MLYGITTDRRVGSCDSCMDPILTEVQMHRLVSHWPMIAGDHAHLLRGRGCPTRGWRPPLRVPPLLDSVSSNVEATFQRPQADLESKKLCFLEA